MAPRIILLLAGVFACSTAAIFIRQSGIHHIMLSACRLLLAALLLSPLFFGALRRHPEYGLKSLANALVPGVLLGIHFITWNMGIRMATVANGSLIVNLVPVVMPFFLFAVVGEKLTRREWVATAVAMGGVGLLVFCDFNLDPRFFIGDLICFGSMLFFCLYLVLSRKYRDARSIWLYVTPLYTAAGVFCLLTAVVWGWLVQPEAAPQLYPPIEWLWVLCLAAIPTVIGHSILNISMRHLRGQVVSIVNLAQFVFAGTMAYFFFGEIPHWSLLVAGAGMFMGVLMVVGGTRRIPGLVRAVVGGQRRAKTSITSPPRGRE